MSTATTGRFLPESGCRRGKTVTNKKEGQEQRIYKVRKWQSLITAILEYYKTKDKLKYKFICLKYFKKLTPIKIQERMSLTEEEQDSLKFEILNYIFAVAIKKNMLKEVEV